MWTSCRPPALEFVLYIHFDNSAYEDSGGLWARFINNYSKLAHNSFYFNAHLESFNLSEATLSLTCCRQDELDQATELLITRYHRWWHERLNLNFIIIINVGVPQCFITKVGLYP